MTDGITATPRLSPQAAAAAKEDEVKQESMREIFSYSGQKRAWR